MIRDIMMIPTDTRNQIDKMPKITKEMKVHCMGEFSWDEQSDYYDEDGNIIKYTAIRVVPWDLCKQIYKKMARIAAMDLSD